MYEDLYCSLLKKVEQGYPCVMLTYLQKDGDRQGKILDKFFLTREDVDKKSIPLCNEIYKCAAAVLDSGRLDMINIDDAHLMLAEPFFPKPRLIVFGGGHIAKPVCEFASRVGFSVTVMDDRPFFANVMRFPDAKEVICDSFEKAVDLVKPRETDFAVIVTRGHRHDGVVLRQFLNFDLAYIGMIGSRRRVRAMMEELIHEGYERERLDRVNSPIGLDIGAITPDEIAVSIVAQLISYKNRGVIDKFGKDFVLPELDMEVAGELSKKSNVPGALITILSSKGSVPRKAGAKMLALVDGRTVGSIGGGCSEAAVINRARDIMHDKGFFIQHVDMTGDVAESEGMVCGGIMEVLVEAF